MITILMRNVVNFTRGKPGRRKPSCFIISVAPKNYDCLRRQKLLTCRADKNKILPI